MFCNSCGKEVANEAVICPGCGGRLRGNGVAANTAKNSNTALILGVLGIIFAWLFALVGHILSIIGIVLGVKEYKVSGKAAGLILSVIGEICAITSSIIGVVIMSGM